MSYAYQLRRHTPPMTSHPETFPTQLWLFGLTGCPLRALNLALCIASGASEIQGHCQLWRGRTGCRRNTSKQLTQTLIVCFQKHTFYIALWLWKANRLRSHFPAVRKRCHFTKQVSDNTTVSGQSDTCQMTWQSWHSPWQQKDRAFIWVTRGELFPSLGN